MGLLAVGAVHLRRLVPTVWLVAILGQVVALRCSLATLLSLARPHLGLFKKSAAFFLLLPQFPVLDLVLANQRRWGAAENRLVLAEFTDPDVLGSWRIVEVLIFRLSSPGLRGEKQLSLGALTGFLLRGFWLIVPTLGGLGGPGHICRLPVGCSGCGVAGLGRLGGLPRAFASLDVMNGHRHGAVSIGAGPADCSGDLRIAGEGELSGGRTALGGLLLLVEETDIFLALMRGQLLCVGNGVRNDTSIFTFRSKNISMQGSQGRRENCQNDGEKILVGG